jgi:hypothetical protein
MVSFSVVRERLKAEVNFSLRPFSVSAFGIWNLAFASSAPTAGEPEHGWPRLQFREHLSCCGKLT